MAEILIAGAAAKAVKPWVYRVAAVVGTVIVVAMITLTVFAWLGKVSAEGLNEKLRGEISDVSTKLGACEATLAQANGKLTEQNTAVRTWKETADRVQREANEAVAKARQEAAQYRKRADRLAKLPTPTAGQCEAAAALYVEVISEDVK